MEKEFNEFLNLIHSMKRTTHKLKTTSVPPAEFMTLMVIQHISQCNKNADGTEGVKISDISKHLDTSKPDISKKIRMMEEKELVMRMDSKQDKRVTFIQITDKGKAVLLESKQRLDSFFNNVFTRMGEEDAKEFIKLCGHMRKAMDEEINEMKKGKEGYEENS